MHDIYKKIIFLILAVSILILPAISYAGHGGGQNGHAGGDPNLPIDTVGGSLANNYTADEITQLKEAWVASGRSLTPSTDFDYAVNYASLMGMPANEFITNTNDPSWDPYTKFDALRNTWYALGYLPGDFLPALQAALDSGKTADQFLADMQQEAADLAKQYQDMLDEFKGYGDLYNQVAAAMANGDPIDWDEIARQLGIEPPYTPDDIWSKLQDLNYYASLAQQYENDRQNSGMTPAQFMNHLLGKTPGPNNKYCVVGDGLSCDAQTRNKINDILNRPNTAPNDGNNGGGEQIKEPLVTESNSNGLLNNLRLQIPSLVRLVFAMSYTIGVVFCIIGMMKLKHIGENRGAVMSHTGGLVAVMAYMITGTALIYLPSSLHMATGTFFALGGDSSAFAYSNEASAGMTFDNLVAVVVDIVKLVGLIAFVRGWILLSKVGSQSSHGTMGKSLVHIVAGILAVNIVTTWEVVRATFDYAW